MNLADLKTELSTHFPGVTDAKAIAADSYWSESVVLQGDITVAQALAWAAGNGVLTQLRVLRADNQSPLFPVADAACTMFDGAYPDFALTNPTIVALIDALVSSGVVTEIQKGSLFALGQTTVKRIWNSYQVGTITPEVVQLALNS